VASRPAGRTHLFHPPKRQAAINLPPAVPSRLPAPHNALNEDASLPAEPGNLPQHELLSAGTVPVITCAAKPDSASTRPDSPVLAVVYEGASRAPLVAGLDSIGVRAVSCASFGASGEIRPDRELQGDLMAPNATRCPQQGHTPGRPGRQGA
jgi:hypothetical protein